MLVIRLHVTCTKKTVLIQKSYSFSRNVSYRVSGDLWGAWGTHVPPTLRASKFFRFSCSFLENLAKSYVGARPPPAKLAPPPWRNPGWILVWSNLYSCNSVSKRRQNAGTWPVSYVNVLLHTSACQPCKEQLLGTCSSRILLLEATCKINRAIAKGACRSADDLQSSLNIILTHSQVSHPMQLILSIKNVRWTL